MSMQRRILQELALATLVGTVVGLSPLVPQHWLASLASGVLAGAVMFAARMRRPAAAEAEGTTWSIPPAVAAALVLWVAVFAPTWAWLYAHWTTSIWSNGHGIFVPLVVGYVGYTTLRRDSEAAREDASRWGLAWILLGCAIALLDAPIRTGYVASAGLILTLPGLSLSLLGRRRTRALAVPLVVALLMMPVPRTLATDMQLRHVTATAVEHVLHAMGVTALREATVIQLPGRTFIVSEACSGFSTLYAGLAMAVILAALSPSIGRRALLLAAAPALALLANSIRVLLLIVLTQRFGSWVIDSMFHPATGVATFAIVFGGLWLIAGRRGLEPSPA
jgi:exosortase